MVVLVTGSSKGIGRSTALLFAQNGYDVVINYNSDLNGALETKKEVEKFGVKALVVKTDVSKEDEVINMIDKIKKRFGKLDCIVNNASLSKDTLPFEKKKYINIIK